MSDDKTAVPPVPRYAIGNRGSFFKRPTLDQVQGNRKVVRIFHIISHV